MLFLYRRKSFRLATGHNQIVSLIARPSCHQVFELFFIVDRGRAAGGIRSIYRLADSIVCTVVRDADLVALIEKLLLVTSV